MDVEWRRRLLAPGVVPVIVMDDAMDAGPLGAALLEGGLPVAEVTLRTPAALEAIRTMSKNRSLFVGAGTVLNAAQVDSAVEAGAQFIVSPGLSSEVITRAKEHGVPVMPGVVTPSEVMRAISMGFDLLKFFPAGAFGGAATISALQSPFGGVEFVPTGGVSESNMQDYLALANVPAVGGSWMVKASLIAAGEFGQIAQLCRSAVATAAHGREAA